MPAFLRDKLGFLSRCAEQYGDVVRLEIAGPTYLLTDADDVGHVLVGNADNYAKSPRVAGRRARRFFGEGVVTSRGQVHLRARRTLQPAFHWNVIQRFATLMIDEAERQLAPWQDGAEVDIHAEMLTLTQRIMMRALLGEESEAEVARFSRAVADRRGYQEHLLNSVFPLPEYVPNRTTRAYRRARTEIDTILRSAVRLRRSRTVSGDLLSMLVQLQGEDGTGLSDSLILDEARTLAIAGYETVAEALTWTWHLLALSREPHDRLVSEVDGVGDGPLGAQDVPRLPYARMVFAEAMRLYPPSWIFVRIAERSDVLPGGVYVPAGAKMYLCPFLTHRSPRYFPDPERFDPERFTEALIRSRPRLAYFPFGAGRRLCLGEEFAWMEGVLLLAHIARRFRLTHVPGQTIVPDPNVTLRPRNGIRMRLGRRHTI